MGTANTKVTSSQIIEGKVPFDAARIERHFILFVPVGKRGSKYQVLIIIFRSKTSIARANRCFRLLT